MVEHNVEAQNLAAQRVLHIIRLARPVQVLQMRLGYAEGLDHQRLDLCLDLGYEFIAKLTLNALEY